MRLFESLAALVDDDVHYLQLPPPPGHWPGRSCVCQPVDIEVTGAACGHLVVVLVHGTVTEELRASIIEDVRKHYKQEGEA